VRLLESRSHETGGNRAIEAALEKPTAGMTIAERAGFVAANTWRFIERFDLVEGTDQLGEYEVYVCDPAWLDGLAEGQQFLSDAFSTPSDALTAEEAASIPDIRNGSVLRPFERRDAEYNAAMSSDGKLLAVASWGVPSEVAVYQTSNMTEVHRAQELGDELVIPMFLPGTRILVALDEGPVDLDANEVLGKDLMWDDSEDLARCTSVSADGGRCAVDCDNEDVVLTGRKGEVLRRFTDPDGDSLQHPYVSADGKRFVAAPWSSPRLYVHDLGVDEAQHQVDLRLPSQGNALSRDGQFVVTIEGEEKRFLYVRRVSDSQVLRYGRHEGRHGAYPHHPMWSPDGKFIVILWGNDEEDGDGAWVELYRV